MARCRRVRQPAHNLFMRFLMLGARSERLTAPTVSLGQVLERSGMSDVGYHKIDCEGGEYDIPWVGVTTPGAGWRLPSSGRS